MLRSIQGNGSCGLCPARHPYEDFRASVALFLVQCIGFLVYIQNMEFGTVVIILLMFLQNDAQRYVYSSHLCLSHVEFF